MSPEEELELLRTRVSELQSAEPEEKEDAQDLDFAFVFGLPPMLEKIFRLLMAQPRVTREQIAARLPQGAEVKCAMFRLRRFIKPVEIQSKRHIGYWITAADKKTLLQHARVTLAGMKKAS